MKNFRTLIDRNRDREAALAKRVELLKRATANRRAAAEKVVSQPVDDRAPVVVSPATVAEGPPAIPISIPLSFPRLLNHEANDQPLQLQPWTAQLVRTLHDGTSDKRIALRLIWPAEISGLATLHAVARFTSVFGRNLVGPKTLFYPGSNATRIALDTLAVDRSQLQDLWRDIWGAADRSGNVHLDKRSRSFEALITACNDVSCYSPEERSPQLRDFIPTFIFDLAHSKWESPVLLPLERIIRKVAKLARRKDMREQIDVEWRDPMLAPGALLVVPRGMKRKEWKAALNRTSRPPRIAPDVLLIDATNRSQRTDPAAVRRVPEFIQSVNETLEPIGGLIVTDDPATFFSLRHQLSKAGLQADTEALAAEAESGDGLYSATRKPDGWTPSTRAAVNFTVSILDKDAAALSIKFGKIAEAVRAESPALEEAFRAAQRFLMRVSHLPGGFVDLDSQDSEERDYLQRGLEWLRVEDPIAEALRQGLLNEHRAQVESAIAKAKLLVAQCTNGTPLALKLLEQVRRFAIKSKDGVTILLASRPDIAVAQRFLARTLGSDWDIARARIEWLRFKETWASLQARSEQRRLVIAGLNRDVVRFALTHPEIPLGTHILVPVQRAVSVAQTLAGMATVEAFKPYRMRIGTLLKTLNQRLSEVPNLATLSKALTSGSASPDRLVHASQEASDPKAYRIRLESGRMIHATGFVYRYDSEEGNGFSRVQVRSVEPGNMIFEMSDELRDEVEEALGLRNDAGIVAASSHHKLLAMYHREVTQRVSDQYPAPSRQAAVRAIRGRIRQLNPEATEISESQLLYWVNLEVGESTPHGARSQGDFQLFCQALGMASPTADLYWLAVRTARKDNQSYGRHLAARYAEILFQPESAQAYRGVTESVIARLRAGALHCVYRVAGIEIPGSFSIFDKGPS